MVRKFTFLGTGTSVGVPCLACDCSVCRSTDSRNRRNRPGALITTASGHNLLIDTPPELRLELLQAGVKLIHSVMFTHFHADHLFGMDDLRQFPKHLNGPVPVYCADDVEAAIRATFGYIFPQPGTPTTTWLPKIEFQRIRPGEIFYAHGERILPLDLIHAQFRVLGFRVGGLAYCTDVNRIPESSQQHLRDLDVLVLGALRYKPHPAHFSLDEAVEMIGKLQPRMAYLTHLSHEIDHEAVERDLPPNIRLGYDGLAIEF